MVVFGFTTLAKDSFPFDHVCVMGKGQMRVRGGKDSDYGSLYSSIGVMRWSVSRYSSEVAMMR